ncbi:hypothetical protein [Vibrio stylophorae]|uniref:hypothetical protein n=1 Tax=Vibrio stylophorae TaxID=659351 RepID=UPI001F20410A|nr:hypothetical protein [Vibrio stylophorae]
MTNDESGILLHPIVTSILLAALAWLTIPTLLFYALFLILWLTLKLDNHHFIDGRYHVSWKTGLVRSLWINMSCFVEDKAFLKLRQGRLKNVLTFIYPIYIFWEKSSIFAIVLFLFTAGLQCFS